MVYYQFRFIMIEPILADLLTNQLRLKMILQSTARIGLNYHNN